jgi:UDP-GlcNAc:undecaprenyl-phosphate GlcNAc-1-phosphate transferase
MGVFFVAFLVAIVVTPLMSRLALRNGVVDVPDLKRKNHALPVAYLGGVAIFLAFVGGVLASYGVSTEVTYDGSTTYRTQRFPLSIFIGAGVIMLTGLIDDVYGIRARVKIGGQLFAAAALTWDHVGIDLMRSATDVLGLSLSTNVLYFLATFMVAVFVVGGCNAVNLLDGLDGLASGVVAIAMAGFLTIALLHHNIPEIAVDNPKRIILCLAVLGAILGFLPYNFNPASIFMGDAGSLLLGFLSVTAILLFGDAGGWSLKTVTAALIVFALPITDTSLAIVRRKLRGQPISAPDNQHLHHLLRRAGLSVRQAVGVMYLVAVGFGLIGVGMIYFELDFRYSLAIFTVIYGIIMAAAFRYGAHCLALEKLRAQQGPPIADQAPIDRPTPPVEEDNPSPLPRSPVDLSRN